MTEIEALEKSIEMWTWLRDEAIQGRVHGKKDWFEKTGNDYVFSNCYLCEYAKESKGEYKCQNCPVENWGKYKLQSSRNVFYYPCTQPESPYSKWSRGFMFGNDVIEGATKMVELLEQTLNDLKLNDLKEKNL